MIHLTQDNITDLAIKVGMKLNDVFHSKAAILGYAVPRGGVPAAYAIGRYCTKLIHIDDPKDADVFLDDIIDSGATKKVYEKIKKVPFYALIDKTIPGHRNDYGVDDWIVFPWEGTIESSMEDNITRLLQFIGENPQRGGLSETPARVAKAWQEWTSGYKIDPNDAIKGFTDGAEKYDEMVVVKDIPFYSHCEHHMAAIFGTATVGYIPDGKIIGLSKVSRLVDIFARRLQVQERLTNQIASAMEEGLKPRGVGIVLKARHLCMESRGINKQGHHTVTSALTGVFKTRPEVRSEFFNLSR